MIGRGEPPERTFGVLAERCLGAPVVAGRELPVPAATSYAARRLILDLADGRTLDVFLKDFDVSPHAADRALWRGSRERYVYEAVLAGQGLGTPELYGVVWDEPGGHHWLLLEFVQGRTLRQSPIEDWIAAAGWLGRLHGTYRPKNILVGASAVAVRICPVDWELAAVGPQFHDLACMAHEVDHRPTIERFCEAYARGADAFGLAVPGTREMLAEVDRLRFHRVLRSLARSAEWAYPDSAVATLVAKADRIRRGFG